MDVVSQRFRDWLTGRYQALLVALFLLMAVTPWLAAPALQAYVFEVALAGILLGALNTRARLHRGLVLLVMLAVLATGARILHRATENTAAALVGYGAHLVFFSTVIYGILRDVLKGGPVTADRIYGAVAAYVLLGLLWAFVYALIESVHPGSFLSMGVPIAGHQVLPTMIYFSLTTLTTVGYGDLVPAVGVARSYAMLEAVMGQLYLAVLISRLISLHVVHASAGDAGARP
ncbi:MAG: potassium channel family protein [Lentisphaerae bacterium]|nr:potassium channel family protein [Lentisphaerota bacterium]